MKAAALLGFALALTAGAQGPNRDRAVDAFDRAAALDNRFADVPTHFHPGAQGPNRDFPSDLRVRGYLQRGIAEFRVGHIVEAARYFQHAVNVLDRAAALDNRFADVRLGALAWPSV